MSDKRRGLYIATCATPAVTQIGMLIELAQPAGWTTCVLVTPNALHSGAVPAPGAPPVYVVPSPYRRADARRAGGTGARRAAWQKASLAGGNQPPAPAGKTP